MTITQLRYFMIAAQMENLSGAAAALYISQSALSKNIASLEKELGMQLFDRRGKSLHLNAAGEQFLGSCRKMLGEYDSALEELKQYDGQSDHRVRIGLEGEAGPLMEMMAEFLELHPETVFEIDSSLDNQEKPDINDYDVMIYPEGRKYSKYSGYPFYEEKYYLALPAGDPLSGKGPLSKKDLQDRDFVFLRHGEKGMEYPYEICRGLLIPVRSEHFVDSESLKRKMIAAGIGAGFVSSKNLDMYQNSQDIHLLPIVSQKFSRQMMICFRKKKYLRGLAYQFCEYVEDIGK